MSSTQTFEIRIILNMLSITNIRWEMKKHRTKTALAQKAYSLEKGPKRNLRMECMDCSLTEIFMVMMRAMLR